ncbi:MAG: ACP S-malonyltransferase [Spirochaetales bacterium]|nr:ACP S-malonyltransferase [Spirochaetales bacterium]
MVENKTAFVFSGQGAQFPGMGKDLWEEYACVKELFEKASDLCSRDMKALLFEGSAEDLKDTQNTQTAVSLVNLSVRRALMEEGIGSVSCAGFSLGEFSAMADAGILTEDAVFSLVAKRGEIMASTGEQVIKEYGSVGMGAVMGLDFETVSSVLAQKNIPHVYAANNNSPVQVVISGTSEGITQAQDALKEAGAKRVIALKVSGPFHTPLLSGGKEELAAFLDTLSFADPVKDFYSNVTGALVSTGQEAKDLSIQQMVSPVQWLVIEKNMSASGIGRVAENGPGTVLTGLWKKSGMEQPVTACGTLEAVKALAGA